MRLCIEFLQTTNMSGPLHGLHEPEEGTQDRRFRQLLQQRSLPRLDALGHDDSQSVDCFAYL